MHKTYQNPHFFHLAICRILMNHHNMLQIAIADEIANIHRLVYMLQVATADEIANIHRLVMHISNI